eukprot:7389845-Prymnesium_polylepis.1
MGAWCVQRQRSRAYLVLPCPTFLLATRTAPYHVDILAEIYWYLTRTRQDIATNAMRPADVGPADVC